MYNSHGAAKRGLGDGQGAIEDYSKAIEINPQYQEAFINRGMATSYLKDANAAARVKVRQRRWVQKCDWETSPMKCVDEPASGRAGPPVQNLWLFADCRGERFASSTNSDRTNSWEQDVFYREGEFAEHPKYQTVHGNPFIRWEKLCPLEARNGEHLR